MLNLAAAKAGWGSQLASGHVHGIALHESFGSIVAQQMEGGRRGDFRLDGRPVQPDRYPGRQGATAQFPDYPMVTLAQAPQVETWIVPSQQPPGGVGEAGVPPLAPALGNALFLITGQRARTLLLRV